MQNGRQDVCDGDLEGYDLYKIGLGNVHSRRGHEAGSLLNCTLSPCLLASPSSIDS